MRVRIHDAAVRSSLLAAVPAADYKAATRGNLFSRAYWIGFSCDESSFKRFVEASPGLRGVVPFRFPFSSADPEPTVYSDPPEYEREMMREAEWFWQTDNPYWRAGGERRRGVRYDFMAKHGVTGTLLRDDETGEVILDVRDS